MPKPVVPKPTRNSSGSNGSMAPFKTSPRSTVVTYDVVRGVLKRYVKGDIDWSQIKALGLLGLDEISLLKGHSDFVTLVSAHDEQGKPIVLAVLKGREKQTLVDFLRSCLAKNHIHLSRVILSMAMRIMFSAVAVNISKSLANRRNPPNIHFIGH